VTRDNANSISARRAPWNRLAFRLGLGLFLGAAAILLLVFGWNLRLQREHMLSAVSSTAESLVETIQRSTRDAMLRNDPEDVVRIIEAIGGQEGVSRIRIFDKEGLIKKSTDRSEVERAVDKSAEQCYACHRQDEPLEKLDRQDRVRIFSVDGRRTFAVIAPIRNEPDCTTACHAHPQEQKVLGVPVCSSGAWSCGRSGSSPRPRTASAPAISPRACR
jgi:hypothetical protein